jgi:hypothetical protein
MDLIPCHDFEESQLVPHSDYLLPAVVNQPLVSSLVHVLVVVVGAAGYRFTTAEGDQDKGAYNIQLLTVVAYLLPIWLISVQVPERSIQ